MGLFDRLFDSAARHAFDEVCATRRNVLERTFGPLSPLHVVPEGVAAIWPAGFLVQQPMPGGGWVTLSCGLTNLGMPAAARLDLAGSPVARVPRTVAPDWAGYGYELAIQSPGADRWALEAVAHIVTEEILRDTLLLERIHDEGACFIEAAGKTLHVRRAGAPLFEEAELPNGILHLLLATAVDRDGQAEQSFA